MRDVDQIIADARVHVGGPRVDVLVADELTRAGRPVSVDAAMDVILADLRAWGYVPAAAAWREPVDGGTRYLFERHE